MEHSLLIMILLAVVLVLLLVILIKVFSNKSNSNEISALSAQVKSIDERMGAEFGRNRQEMATAQRQMSEMTAEKMQLMSEQINRLTISNMEQQNKINETVSTKLDQLQRSNEQKLEKMRETVDEKLSKTINARLDTSFKQVSEQLENVYKSLGEVKTLSSGVTDNISALNRVLTNVKARGTWAEIQLGNILDQTIPGMYETNIETVRGSGERVEFAVKVPAEDDKITYLPLDSKFPLEDYVRLMDAIESGIKEEIEAARKQLERSVVVQAKAVTKYINVPQTTPFAILYLATEGLYAEIASSRTGLVEKLQTRFKIMVAGPSTITALLNSLAMGFKTIAINKKADEIAHSLAAAKTQYGKFSDILDVALKRIEDAGKKVGEARQRNDMIQKKLKKFEDLEESEADSVLELEGMAVDEED
ncbi:MAG: DNA recombination protein RmuC [Ruminococcaceae bacterium]|nr:DNA recombination protein RmuC [Oscillospiraceae bacterium]